MDNSGYAPWALLLAELTECHRDSVEFCSREQVYITWPTNICTVWLVGASAGRGYSHFCQQGTLNEIELHLQCRRSVVARNETVAGNDMARRWNVKIDWNCLEVLLVERTRSIVVSPTTCWRPTSLSWMNESEQATRWRLILINC